MALPMLKDERAPPATSSAVAAAPADSGRTRPAAREAPSSGSTSPAITRGPRAPPSSHTAFGATPGADRAARYLARRPRLPRRRGPPPARRRRPRRRERSVRRRRGSTFASASRSTSDDLDAASGMLDAPPHREGDDRFTQAQNTAPGAVLVPALARRATKRGDVRARRSQPTSAAVQIAPALDAGTAGAARPTSSSCARADDAIAQGRGRRPPRRDHVHHRRASGSWSRGPTSCAGTARPKAGRAAPRAGDRVRPLPARPPVGVPRGLQGHVDARATSRTAPRSISEEHALIAAFPAGGPEAALAPVAALLAEAAGLLWPTSRTLAVAGVIGADLLKDHVVDLGFAPCRVRVSDAGKAPAFRGRELALGWDQGRPTAPAAVSGRRPRDPRRLRGRDGGQRALHSPTTWPW